MFVFKFGKPYICTYCGQPADTKDHLIPYSFLTDKIRKTTRPLGFMTFACKECNELLSNKLHDTFQKRIKYINNKLRKKYRKDMGVLWDEEDLSQVEGNLKKYIIAKNKLNLTLRQRVDWINTEDYQKIITEACDRLYYDKKIDKKYKLFLIDDTYIPSITEDEFYCRNYDYT